MSVKWEVNITRKYNVASIVITFKILGISSPCVFDAFAKNMINANVRNSGTCALLTGSVSSGDKRWLQQTVDERDTGVCDL